MALLYAGIDEAGYGPMLGPLCVGAATLRLDSFAPEASVPDLWELLCSAVGKAKRDFAPKNGGRIPIADSKVLKLGNSTKTKHPCTYLELAVLAFLAAGHPDHDFPRTDLELFDRLGVSLGTREDAHPWYTEPDPVPLPLGVKTSQLQIAANALSRAMGKAGVSLAGLSVRTIDEQEFNGMIRERGSKAAATSTALAEHLKVIRDLAHESRPSGEPNESDATPSVRIVADRHSGRLDYRGPITRAWPGVPFSTIEQSPRASVYAVDKADCRVLLMSEAENRHLPVALASMAAKLVRELAMARFNTYWAARMPELKPTAGYVTDARRWLIDAEPVLSKADRRAMVRLA